jgi:hypothetical protein
MKARHFSHRGGGGRLGPSVKAASSVQPLETHHGEIGSPPRSGKFFPDISLHIESVNGTAQK